MYGAHFHGTKLGSVDAFVAASASLASPRNVLYSTFCCHAQKMATLTFNLNKVCLIHYWIDDPVVVISLNH